jgi:hypothetical protein
MCPRKLNSSIALIYRRDKGCPPFFVSTITVPLKDNVDHMVVMGVNDDHILSDPLSITPVLRQQVGKKALGKNYSDGTLRSHC